MDMRVTLPCRLILLYISGLVCSWPHIYRVVCSGIDINSLDWKWPSMWSRPNSSIFGSGTCLVCSGDFYFDCTTGICEFQSHVCAFWIPASTLSEEERLAFRFVL